MRAGIKTAEFAIVVLAILTAIIQNFVQPGAAFPVDSYITLGVYVAGRFAEKALGPADTAGKRYWQTSEFWIAIGITVLEAFFAGFIPPGLTGLTWTYIGGRPITKGLAGFQIGGAETQHTEPPADATKIGG